MIGNMKGMKYMEQQLIPMHEVPLMRTIEQVYEYIKANDPDTALTENAIRRLVTTGKIETVKAGTKYLINMDMFFDYLSNQRGSY